MGLIKKPNELTVKNALSALIYGQPGMGKTTLALSKNAMKTAISAAQCV